MPAYEDAVCDLLTASEIALEKLTLGLPLGARGANDPAARRLETAIAAVKQYFLAESRIEIDPDVLKMMKTLW
jgi:hypothetical protein